MRVGEKEIEIKEKNEKKNLEYELIRKSDETILIGSTKTKPNNEKEKNKKIIKKIEKNEKKMEKNEIYKMENENKIESDGSQIYLIEKEKLVIFDLHTKKISAKNFFSEKIFFGIIPFQQLSFIFNFSSSCFLIFPSPLFLSRQYSFISTSPVDSGDVSGVSSESNCFPSDLKKFYKLFFFSLLSDFSSPFLSVDIPFLSTPLFFQHDWLILISLKNCIFFFF